MPGHHLLSELATRTGGRAFFDRNDLETPIRRALEDSRTTYTLGYYPNHDAWNGKFRKIQIKLNRTGLDLLVRQGYFALPPAPPVPAKDRIAFLEQVAASPLDATGFALDARVEVKTDDGTEDLSTRVSFNPQPLLRPGADSRWAGHFEVLYLQLDAKNFILDATDKTIDADFSAAEYAGFSSKAVDFPADLKLMPRAATLCVILHDTASDAVGSVQIPLSEIAQKP
jgi:hypothetical protein